MKNNRRTKLDAYFLSKYPLSTSPPSENSLFWKMWNACISIAEATLQTDFIQGIKQGDLDPIKYGGFHITDAYYCYNGEQDYLIAEDKAIDPTLKALLLKKHQNYHEFNQSFPTIWHIKDPYGIVPNDVCKYYSEFKSIVAYDEEPIYTLIVTLSCEYLWAWLGAQLSPPAKGNLYASWIHANNDPDAAYAIGNFIDEYQKHHSINENKAIKLFTQAMNFELQNFEAATIQLVDS